MPRTPSTASARQPPEPGAFVPCAGAATSFLDQLTWWVAALREACADRPSPHSSADELVDSLDLEPLASPTELADQTDLVTRAPDPDCR
jgi:hypothetical protein